MQKISEVYSKTTAVGQTRLDEQSSNSLWCPTVHSVEVLKLHCDFRKKPSKIIYLLMLPLFFS